jgi:hypothetical protein
MNPTEKLRRHLSTLKDINGDLEQLYGQATLDKNKSAIIYIQLEILHAIGKYKKFLKIPLEADEKKAAKQDSFSTPSPFREEE